MGVRAIWRLWSRGPVKAAAAILAMGIIIALLAAAAHFEVSTHVAISEHLAQAAEALPDHPDEAIHHLDEALNKWERLTRFSSLLAEDDPYLGSDFEERVGLIINAIEQSGSQEELLALKKTLEIEAELARPEGQ